MTYQLTDRLSQLRHSSHHPRDSEYAPDDVVLGEEDDDFLHGLLGTVDELTRNVNEISLRVEKIKHNQNVILASVQNQEAKDESNQLMNEVKKISKKVHAGLKHLKEEIAAEEQGPARNTADFRIKKAQVLLPVVMWLLDVALVITFLCLFSYSTIPSHASSMM